MRTALMTAAAWLLFTLSPALAEQVVVASGDGTVRGYASLKEITRISLSGDRIVGLKRQAGTFDYQNDNTSGDLFISYLPGTVPAPLNFFIVSERGYTYKVVLDPRDVPAETIFIRNPDLALNAEASEWERESPFQETVVRLIKAMANGEMVRGYSARALAKGFSFADGLELVQTGEYQGNQLRGEIYTVRNASAVTTTLSEHQFRRQGVVAVHLAKSVLAPGETSLVHVVAAVGG